MKAELAWDIAETSHALRRYYDRRAQALGITRAQWRVLAFLRRSPGQKQVCLADRLDVEPITLSRIVDRLENSGLVARHPDPTDRRAWLLGLTPAAEPLVAKLFGLAGEMAEQAFAGLSDEEVQQMRDSLAAIRVNVNERDDGRKAVA